jgi:hypothetical protein
VGRLFQGKFRGKVLDNRDPLHLGRLRVEVPEVLGDGTMCWAMPCVPYAGRGVGLLASPPAGANVWVEFEAGMADRPIWVGCFWATGELPTQPSTSGVVFRAGAVTLVTSDGPGPDVVAPAAAGTPATELTVSADGLVVSQNGRVVVTVKKDTVKVELATLQIALSTSDGTVRLASGGASVVVAADAIEIAQGASKARVSDDGVALSSGSGSAQVAPAAVKLANGSGNVAVTPATVSINDGALEVT